MSAADIKGRYAMTWILDAALESTPQGGVWVEIGVALGKGVATMARKLIDAGRDDVTLYAVDPWAGFHRNGEQQETGDPTRHGDWALFLDTMQTHAPEELRRIHVLRCDSMAAYALLFSRPGPMTVDLVILDGDHSYEVVSREIYCYQNLLRRGGILAGDDHHEVEHPGVVQACREAFGRRTGDRTGVYDYEVREECGWPTWMWRKP